MASRRELSRQVDKIRKRYRRDIAKYSIIAETSKGHRKAVAESMIARAEKAIGQLKYDRSKGGYNEFVMSKIGTIEFESQKENRLAMQRLKVFGQDSAFYATTKDLWYMKDNGFSANENIVYSLHEKGYDVSNLNEAIDLVSRMSGIDFDSSSDTSNEWERYSEESVLVGMMALRSQF